MSWRMAKSLEVLLKQLNTLAPKRDRSSDGGIGNAEHSARASDHNPDDDGVVKARDFTNDPAHGVDSEKLAEMLRTSQDQRIKYIISNRKIAASSPTDGQPAWAWRKYGGTNLHDHHCHVSVKRDAAHFDSEKPWKIALSTPVVPMQKPKELLPKLRKGIHSESVSTLQKLLNENGAKLKVDSDFGGVTEAAVKVFQEKRGIVADGIVGRYTWEALG